jgi:HEAT repeat protein
MSVKQAPLISAICCALLGFNSFAQDSKVPLQAADTKPSATSAQQQAVMARQVEVSPQRQAAIASRRIRQHHASSISDRNPTEQEALAIAALSALMSVPPERALPLLERTLRLQKSELVKARALFVLGQIGTAPARSLLLKNATDLRGPLQLEAIRAVGIGGDVASLKALLPIFISGDSAQQESVISALTIADDRALLAQLAVMAKDPDQREMITDRLAAIGAVAELRQLASQGIAGINLARAYAIAGDVESVLKIARSDPSADARVEAIRSLGMIRKDEAKRALLGLYQNAKTPEEKAAARSGLLMAGDQAGVLSLYRATKDATEKRELLQTLGMMGGDAALEAIDAALDGKQP